MPSKYNFATSSNRRNARAVSAPSFISTPPCQFHRDRNRWYLIFDKSPKSDNFFAELYLLEREIIEPYIKASLASGHQPKFLSFALQGSQPLKKSKLITDPKTQQGCWGEIQKQIVVLKMVNGSDFERVYAPIKDGARVKARLGITASRNEYTAFTSAEIKSVVLV